MLSCQEPRNPVSIAAAAIQTAYYTIVLHRREILYKMRLRLFKSELIKPAGKGARHTHTNTDWLNLYTVDMIRQTSSAAASAVRVDSGWNKRTETSARCFAIGCNYRQEQQSSTAQDLTFSFFAFYFFGTRCQLLVCVYPGAWKRIRDSRRRKV